MLHQKIVYNHAHVGWREFSLIDGLFFTQFFGFDFTFFERNHRVVVRCVWNVARASVAACENGGDHRCGGRRTTNAQFFEFFHECAIGVARGTLCETLLSRGFNHVDILFVDEWQASRGIAVGIVVGCVHVDAQKTIECHHFARGNELFLAAIDVDVDGGMLKFCIGHLRSHSTFPNQFVEALLVGCAGDGMVVDVGRTNGLVRLLCAFGFSVILANFHVVFASHLDHLFFDCSEG